MNRKFHAKWAGPNTPFIKYCKDSSSEERFYLSKRELKDLAIELNNFIQYYDKDFSEDRLDTEDEPYEPFESPTEERYKES